MNLLIDEIINLINQKQGMALATIISRNGSAPRMAGAQMIVRADGCIVGTIGGGLMEAQVIQLARTVIEHHECTVTRIEMTGETAATGEMICGGIQDVLVEYFNPADQRLVEALLTYQTLVRQRRLGWWITKIPTGKIISTTHGLIQNDGTLTWDGENLDGVQVDFSAQEAGKYHNALERGAPVLTISGKSFNLKYINHPTLETIQDARWLIDPILFYGTVYIFGAGHVSQQLAKVTKLVGFRTVVIDDRAEFVNSQRFPEADELVVVPDYDRLFDRIHMDPESYMVIVTRGHLHDRNVLAQCLQTGAVYIGMIGSKRKVALVYEQLEKQGFTREQLDQVYSPIGLKIGAESPEEIAVSITAELIKVRTERNNR